MKKMDTNAQLGGAFITLMFTIIIGIIGISIAVDVINDITKIKSVTNETWVSTAPTLNTWYALNNDDLVPNSETVYANISNSWKTMGTTCYNMNYTDGKIQPVNQSATCDWANASEATCSYQYYPDGYVTDSATRTILDLLPLMISVVLIIACASVIGRR